MNKDNPTFITISPGDPRHRQVIAAAIKANDIETLARLKNNTHKPIRFVSNGFMYLLMASSWATDRDAGCVVIYGLDARKSIAKIASLHQPEGGPEQDSHDITIPLDTYDFLQ
ncbi:hypothetical protein [Spirosoma areae]